MTETSIMKDRPPQLRRRPRPAPDETVDPADYSPANPIPPPAAPPVQQDSTPSAGGGGEEGQSAVEEHAAAAPAVEEATEKDAPAQAVEESAGPVHNAAQVQAPAPAAAAPARPRTSRAKAAPNKKTQRREVTFPLSTRVSQEILDLLYEAQEEHGVTLRNAIGTGRQDALGFPVRQLLSHAFVHSFMHESMAALVSVASHRTDLNAMSDRAQSSGGPSKVSHG